MLKDREQQKICCQCLIFIGSGAWISVIWQNRYNNSSKHLKFSSSRIWYWMYTDLLEDRHLGIEMRNTGWNHIMPFGSTIYHKSPSISWQRNWELLSSQPTISVFLSNTPCQISCSTQLINSTYNASDFVALPRWWWTRTRQRSDGRPDGTTWTSQTQMRVLPRRKIVKSSTEVNTSQIASASKISVPYWTERMERLETPLKMVGHQQMHLRQTLGTFGVFPAPDLTCELESILPKDSKELNHSKQCLKLWVTIRICFSYVVVIISVFDHFFQAVGFN